MLWIQHSRSPHPIEGPLCLEMLLHRPFNRDRGQGRHSVFLRKSGSSPNLCDGQMKNTWDLQVRKGSWSVLPIQ